MLILIYIFSSRLQIFASNKQSIDEHNNQAAQGMATYTQGENHLTDLSSEEMKTLLGASIPQSGRKMPILNVKAVTTGKPTTTTAKPTTTTAKPTTTTAKPTTTTAKPTTTTAKPTTTTAKPTTTTTAIVAPTSGLDWRNTAGMVQAIRNQGSCG